MVKLSEFDGLRFYDKQEGRGKQVQTGDKVVVSQHMAAAQQQQQHCQAAAAGVPCDLFLPKYPDCQISGL